MECRIYKQLNTTLKGDTYGWNVVFTNNKSRCKKRIRMDGMSWLSQVKRPNMDMILYATTTRHKRPVRMHCA